MMRYDAGARRYGLVLASFAMVMAMSSLALAQVTVASPSGSTDVQVVRPAEPQQGLPSPLKGVVRELRRGPLLIHGNFCGIGNRPGAAPIDVLDAACMRHDACTRTGKLPNCACDDRLRVEATAIARDPRTPADLQLVASATASAMAVLICKTGSTVAVPILPQPR